MNYYGLDMILRFFFVILICYLTIAYKSYPTHNLKAPSEVIANNILFNGSNLHILIYFTRFCSFIYQSFINLFVGFIHAA